MSPERPPPASPPAAPTALIFDPRFLAHRPGATHPERPERLEHIVAALEGTPPAGTVWLAPRHASAHELEAVHPAEHLAALAKLDGKFATIDEDTFVSPGSWEAARLAAGAAMTAVDELWAGRCANAFALVRPPGHHAEATKAMGFCLLNNAAIAAAHARRLGARRVAIVDWDVHHGNGTQQIFERRSDVLFLSVHQAPLYPGTGAAGEVGYGDGAGFTVNCPLPAGEGDGAYGAVFGDLFVPLLDRFAPDLIVVSAGFDAHAADPLAEMRVTERGFAAMCSAVCETARRHSRGRVLLLLEGGYDLGALAASARACVDVLCGGLETFPSGVSAAAAASLAATQRALRAVSRGPGAD